MFCAPRRIFLVSRMAFETSLNAVNGGHTTISTSFTLVSSIFNPRTRSSASATVLFIFQFPAIISFRSLFMYQKKREKSNAKEQRGKGAKAFGGGIVRFSFRLLSIASFLLHHRPFTTR